MLGVPGVASRTPVLGFRHALGPELGGIGHAEDHQPRVKEPLRHQGVPVGHVIGQRPRTARRWKAPILLIKVFDQKGHPGKRSAQIRIGGLPIGDVVEAADDRVQPWIDGVGTLPRQSNKFGRGDLFALDQLGQSGRIQ